MKFTSVLLLFVIVMLAFASTNEIPNGNSADDRKISLGKIIVSEKYFTTIYTYILILIY